MKTPLLCVALASLAISSAFCEESAAAADTLKATLTPLVQADRAKAVDRSTEIQQLVNAAPTGGTVQIPAGCYEVDQVIYVTNGKQIVGEGPEKTILYRGAVESRNHQGGIFKFAEPKTDGGRPSRVSGLSFIGVQDSSGAEKDWDFGVVLSNAKDFRVDHCYFEGFGLAGVKVMGQSRGVVDHCIFVNNFKPAINTVGYGVVVYGAEEWPEDPQLGSADATVVEDCIFIGNRHAISANAGAHYVFRHNLVQRNVAASAIDAHGPGYGSTRGTRAFEIYENTIDDPTHKWCGIGIRGGEGVIFKNTIKDYQYPIYLFLEFDMTPEMKAQFPVKDQVQNLWIWDNQILNGPAEPQIEKGAVEHIRPDHEFFTAAKPGYKPLEYPHPLVTADTAR